MWTSGHYIGAGQYVPGDGRGCLVCAYPESVEAELDEVNLFHHQTGLYPDVVRELLDSARGLTPEEAQTVSQAKACRQSESLVSRFARSFQVLCATGKVSLEQAKKTVDVPFLSRHSSGRSRVSSCSCGTCGWR